MCSILAKAGKTSRSDNGFWRLLLDHHLQLPTLVSPRTAQILANYASNNCNVIHNKNVILKREGLMKHEDLQLEE